MCSSDLREHPERLHLLWWAIGIATYGVGTFSEATTTLVGWSTHLDGLSHERAARAGATGQARDLKKERKTRR